jgi:hypothetical protein
MRLEQLQVHTRDDYRGAQEPRSFIWREQHFEITQVIDRWYEGSMDSSRMPMRYFRVETTGGKQFLLRYHEFFHTWSILIPSQCD